MKLYESHSHKKSLNSIRIFCSIKIEKEEELLSIFLLANYPRDRATKCLHDSLS